MKILVKIEEQNIRLTLPTNLVFSSPFAWIADRACTRIPDAVVENMPSRAADAVAKISPGAMGKLFAEIRRIKKRYGSWTLVELDSASGEQVLITL